MVLRKETREIFQLFRKNISRSIKLLEKFDFRKIKEKSDIESMVDFYEDMLVLRNESILMSAKARDEYDYIDKKYPAKKGSTKTIDWSDLEKPYTTPKGHKEPNFFISKFPSDIPEEFFYDGLTCNLSDIYGELFDCKKIITKIINPTKMTHEELKDYLADLEYSLESHLVGSHIDDFFVLESDENGIGYAKGILTNLKDLIEYYSKDIGVVID